MQLGTNKAQSCSTGYRALSATADPLTKTGGLWSVAEKPHGFPGLDLCALTDFLFRNFLETGKKKEKGNPILTNMVFYYARVND